MDSVAPSVVFHLAAQPLVRNGMRDPSSTFATNVQGTVHLLSAVRSAPSPVEAVVISTTDKVYRPGLTPHREDDPLGGHDPYAWSKVMVEQVAEAFRELPELGDSPAWRTPLATARAGNVIGGGDWSDERLVPDCIRAFEANVPVVLRFPSAVRPWQHVLEPLCGYLILAESLLNPGESPQSAWSYNFGPSDEQSGEVGHIASELADRWNGTARVDRQVDADAPAENPWLRLDSRRAVEELGWFPRWDLQTTLDRTVDAYRAMTSGGDAATVVDGQIQGGLAHGIGNALYEHMRYDASAQPITTHFGDYLLPLSTDVPVAEIVHLESPTPLNPLGVKGAGEGGTIPAAATVVSAVEDALKRHGAPRFTSHPLSPYDVLSALGTFDEPAA
jgi:CDP-glucose 4,6-dehydratase